MLDRIQELMPKLNSELRTDWQQHDVSH
jgi:hypothetical protein